MERHNLIFIGICLIIAQIFNVSSEDIDWTTAHEELRKLAGNIRKRCITESGTTEEVLNAVELGEFPEDNKLACYLKCVMDKGGVLKKDGKINFKLLSKMTPPAYKHIMVQMIDECRDTRGKDKCDLAFNFNRCMYNANPVAFFVI